MNKENLKYLLIGIMMGTCIALTAFLTSLITYMMKNGGTFCVA